jgi:acetyl esterase/lipase
VRKSLWASLLLLVGLLLGLVGGYTFATSKRTAEGKPQFAPNGTVHVPAFDLPPSVYMSKEAVNLLKLRAAMFMGLPSPKGDIAQVRDGLESLLSTQVKDMTGLYPANIVEDTIAGVPVRIVTPKDGKFDPDRVLINLHGGGFMVCAKACALLESLPIASVGGFKVISVNYRMAPEAVFPAASEDIAAVYSELLKTYPAKHIGIYGCSAGGMLTAEAAAWLPAHGLPQAGAIGIFGAGGVRFGAGDSAYVSAYIDGSFPPPDEHGVTHELFPFRPYFGGVDMSDPMVSPALHLDLLTKFPPTLLITGTRAADLTPATYTHSQLVKAGVPGDLIAEEGMGHCYMYFAKYPEAQDAYRTIADFFQKNLR